MNPFALSVCAHLRVSESDRIQNDRVWELQSLPSYSFTANFGPPPPSPKIYKFLPFWSVFPRQGKAPKPEDIANPPLLLIGKTQNMDFAKMGGGGGGPSFVVIHDNQTKGSRATHATSVKIEFFEGCSSGAAWCMCLLGATLHRLLLVLLPCIPA